MLLIGAVFGVTTRITFRITRLQMQLPPHVIQPHGNGTYYLRLRVPPDLYRKGWRPAEKPRPVKFIVEKLAVTGQRTVKQEAKSRRDHWHDLFERARSGAPLSRNEVNAAAERGSNAMRRHLEASAEVMRDVFKDKANTPQLAEVKWLEAFLEGWPEALATDDFERVKEDVAEVEQLCAIPPLQSGSDTHTMLCRALLRAKITAITNRMKVLKGEQPDIRASYLAGDEYDPDTMMPRPAARSKVRRRVEHGPFALFEQWVAKKKPAASSVNRWRAVFDDLQSRFGAKEISAADAKAWAEALIGPQRSERTVSEVWVNAARTVYGWAARQDPPLSSNPFASVRIDVPEKIETRETLAFTKKEARMILRAASSIQPTTPFNAAKRWVSWLQAYSGARAGEITQLRGQDIQKEDGVWFMVITPLAGTTKNKKVRRVPLHQHLIEQGFLEFVKKHGKGPLFYSTESKRRSDDNDPTNPARSRAVKTRERLASWVRELGVNDAAVSPTHGWRHLFKQIAGSEDVLISERVSDWITGHAHKSEGARYGKPDLPQLARALTKFPRFDR
jgi:integrase